MYECWLMFYLRYRLETSWPYVLLRSWNIGHDIVIIMSAYVCTHKSAILSFCVMSSRIRTKPVSFIFYTWVKIWNAHYSPNSFEICLCSCVQVDADQAKKQGFSVRKVWPSLSRTNKLRFSWATAKFSFEGTYRYTIQCTPISASYKTEMKHRNIPFPPQKLRHSSFINAY